MRSPLFATINIAEFEAEVFALPLAQRGVWGASLAQALATNDPALNPYAARLLAPIGITDTGVEK